MSNKDWKSIPLPNSMMNLKKDKYGMIVPYNVLVDNSGTPHFKVNDDEKVTECINHTLCGICGSFMIDDMWMVGGPGSAFNPRGVYFDIPIHYGCGEYALKVCPYLASRVYNPIADVEQAIKSLSKIDTDTKIFFDATVDPARPKVFIFQKISGYGLIPNGPAFYLKPNRPYLKIEFWNKGEKLSEKDGLDLLSPEDVYYYFGEKLSMPNYGEML